MAFMITFPIDIGTFVITNVKDLNLDDPKALKGHFGTIACYQCVDNDTNNHLVMVSGYKDNWCGEYLLSDLLIATDEQIKIYKDIMGIYI